MYSFTPNGWSIFYVRSLVYIFITELQEVEGIMKNTHLPVSLCQINDKLLHLHSQGKQSQIVKWIMG